MRSSFFAFVRHTLQNAYLKISAVSNLGDQDRLEFTKRVNMLGNRNCGASQPEVVHSLLSLFQKIEADYLFHRNFEILVDAEEERIFSSSLAQCRNELSKLTAILEGRPHAVMKEEFDLGRIVGDITPLIGLTSYRSPSRLFVFADKLDVFLLLENLISNSVRACESKGIPPFVDIIAFPSDNYRGMAEITVKDDGVGFTPGELLAAEEKRKFTTKEKGDGEIHGIGLSHCRFIVEQHGGSFSISSIKGAGSEIMFTLPLSMQK